MESIFITGGCVYEPWAIYEGECSRDRQTLLLTNIACRAAINSYYMKLTYAIGVPLITTYLGERLSIFYFCLISHLVLWDNIRVSADIHHWQIPSRVQLCSWKRTSSFLSKGLQREKREVSWVLSSEVFYADWAKYSIWGTTAQI